MKELLRSNDLVLLSWVEATLQDAGIEAFLFDQYASAIEGPVGPVQRRVMVHDDDLSKAQWIINVEQGGAAP